MIRDEAIAILRNLMGRVELRQRGDGWQVDLLGEIAALVTVGLGPNSKAPQAGLQTEALNSMNLVAGARFELATFRL